ncbi:MAG: 50S ribosomal protein L10 [Candidatus Marinimicrobia bacterium]|nr:50S ribosomal protein L10 [Candidatus Neomarinimicrobiota bacterium]
MPTPKKIERVQEITEKIKGAGAVYFSDYLGLSVAEINELRSKLFEKDVKMQVVKNTLILLAMKELGYDIEKEAFLTGSTALVYGADPVAPAKILKEFKKKMKDLKKPDVKALIFEGELCGKEKVDQIAELPSMEILFSTLLSGLQSPMQKVLGCLQSPMRDLLGILKSLEETKQ